MKEFGEAELDLESKWQSVEGYYSRAYRITFRERPSKDKIEFLWGEMIRLGRSLAREYEKSRPELLRYLKRKEFDQTGDRPVT